MQRSFAVIGRRAVFRERLADAPTCVHCAAATHMHMEERLLQTLAVLFTVKPGALNLIPIFALRLCRRRTSSTTSARGSRSRTCAWRSCWRRRSPPAARPPTSVPRCDTVEVARVVILLPVDVA